MFQMTIERALQEHSVAKGYCLYLFRDGETILYVGRSHRPLERLREHLGWGEYEAQASHLGDIILKQFPGSLAWTVDFYTLAECQDLVAQCRPEYALWFEEQIKKNLVREASEIAEEVFIEHYRPCLNIAGNSQGQLLPEKYR